MGWCEGVWDGVRECERVWDGVRECGMVRGSVGWSS